MDPLLQQYADVAATRLHPGWFDYLSTGSGEEISLGEAVDAWRRYRLRPRVLRPVREVSTDVDVLGQRLRTPVLAAPTAWHRLAHPEAEVATARGVREAGSLMVLSTRSATPMEAVAEAAGPWWLQVYLTQQREICRDLVRRAAELGAGALVLTGDTPVVANKARNRVAPEDSAPSMLAPFVPPNAPAHATVQDPQTSLDDIAWLAAESGLPVLVKGVLRGDDARDCLSAGAAGLVVSNHGGRQLDRAVATADVLGEVVQAVDGRAPVLIDGGIRSGIDALIALGLGADAVMLGRPVLWGLAADGADGVGAALGSVTRGLREAMQLLGVDSLGAIGRADVVGPAAR